MNDHDLTQGVAVRLSALCLTDAGKLRRYDIWDVAVRGALLVDLALAGRVTQEAESVVVDAHTSLDLVAAPETPTARDAEMTREVAAR